MNAIAPSRRGFGFRLRAALASWLLGPVQDRYEAAVPWSSRRSWLPAWIRDARFDADIASQREILRKARYFERNNGIVNRLADLFEQYTVGANGLIFVPASSDSEWNKRAKAWWDVWCEYPDISTLQNFGTLNGLSARSWFIDGELFIVKTRGRPRAGLASFPRIELIESHRVETPAAAVDSSTHDGIVLDTNGRPTHYWIRRGDEDKFTSYEAKDVVHVFEPSRPGQLRGLSMLYPVINDLHDLDDLQILEMDASKERAKVFDVIQNKAGELSADDFRAARFTMPGTAGTSGGSSQARTQYYEDVFKGGRPLVLKQNDIYTRLSNDNPSVAVREYWDYITSKICAGVGISKLLVFPWSMQGTVTRADLDVASMFFRSRSALLASRFKQVYEYVMEWATLNVRELSDPPADWKSVSVRPPRSVNVDVGRNSNVLIEEYKAGWRTLEQICGELGEDWMAVLRQRAAERATARDIEVEFGLQPGELINAALEALKQAAPAAPQQSNLQEAA